MDSKIIKRSLTLKGHRTSVSLEAEFWDAFKELACERGVSVNALAAMIDTKRIDEEDAMINLSSALRIFVLKELQHKLSRYATNS